MASDVKGASRTQQTQATRRRIVDAAAELFIAEGYAATTLAQVARRAGVAVQTVYFHFGNKRTVLKEAVDVAAVGDDEPVALLERPWLERVRAEPDPRLVIELWLDNSRTIMERVGPIMRVVRDAAATDPEMAAQWKTNAEQRATAFGVLAQLLDDRAALRVPLDEATDILCALLGLELHSVLVDRGWTSDRWQRWVTETLVATLLQ
ncbi:helix-turn-helix domain-containing protein [Pseudonocardia xishanensis]|uniref:TetR/AcrR family transcriptional regulator n=1 Tax=Pseudonocardia xishanensis TaxID=630995 RepID=A0ABP8S0H4_9PSEU